MIHQREVICKHMPAPKKKKKVDREALNSAFMRIPGMKVEAARDLIDLGLREIYQLQGRAPESLLSDLIKLREVPDANSLQLPCFRLAVYFAENDPPDRSLLTPDAWQD